MYGTFFYDLIAFLIFLMTECIFALRLHKLNSKKEKLKIIFKHIRLEKEASIKKRRFQYEETPEATNIETIEGLFDYAENLRIKVFHSAILP